MLIATAERNCVLAPVRLPNSGSEGVLVSLGRPTFALGTRRAKRRRTSFRSPLTAFLVALSLIVQLFAAATPPASAAPAFAGADDAAIAAELKAVFGDAAGFCAHTGDKGAPDGPCNRCDDQCPLCWFVGQTAAYVPPDLPALPERRDSDAHAIRAPLGHDVLPYYPVQPNPARAPPLPV